MPQVVIGSYAEAAIASNSAPADPVAKSEPASSASRSPATLTSGWDDAKTETNPDLTAPYNDSGAPQRLRKGDPSNPEGRMLDSPRSRGPNELAQGFGQDQADPGFVDGSPARSAPGAHGEPTDPRVQPTMPPERSRTSTLQGQPGHTCIDGPPTSSSFARPQYQQPAAEQSAFRARQRHSPRG